MYMYINFTLIHIHIHIRIHVHVDLHVPAASSIYVYLYLYIHIRMCVTRCMLCKIQYILTNMLYVYMQIPYNIVRLLRFMYYVPYCMLYIYVTNYAKWCIWNMLYIHYIIRTLRITYYTTMYCISRWLDNYIRVCISIVCNYICK